MANGGEVAECHGPHKPDCEYYMAEGGQMPQQQQTVDQDPGETLGSAAIHGGLLGLLQNTGHAQLAHFTDKHHKMLSDAKSHNDQPIMEGMEQPNSEGRRFGKHMSEGNYDKASDLLYGSQLAGNTRKSHLKPILQRLGPEVMQREGSPEGFRSAVNYLSTSIKGGEKLKDYTSSIFKGRSMKVSPDEKVREGLKEHLENLKMDPDSAINTGGDLGHYLPTHTAQLGALTGTAASYLNSIKPQQMPSGPLDKPLPLNKAQEAGYDRQLDIAQQPLMALEHAKNGTLLPQDMTTLTTLYPSLYKKMVSQLGEDVIAAKASGSEVPYKTRLGLSRFMGQPLDSTLNQPNILAAMVANAPKMPPQPPNTGKKPSKLSAAQQEKTNSLYETNTQSADSKKD
jgi:hypothetical protein